MTSISTNYDSHLCQGVVMKLVESNIFNLTTDSRLANVISITAISISYSGGVV